MMVPNLLRALLVLTMPTLAFAGLGDPAPSASPSIAPHAAATDRRLPDGLYAELSTPRGQLVARLHPDLAPVAVANFVGLAEGTITFEGRPAGQPFYDGLVFHRVVEGFVVQGGDPLGNGEGGPGYEFPDEFTPRLKHDAMGVLAMANAGPNTNGSQFYFTMSAVPRLNYKHTVFGRLVEGVEILPRIQQGDTIAHVRILRVGAEAARFRPTSETFLHQRTSAAKIEPRDPSLPPLFVDEAALDLPEFYPAWLNDKLHHIAVVRGVTIFVRTQRSADAAAEAKSVTVDALHQTLAGDAPRAATVLFDAGTSRWTIHLGPGLRTVLGAPGESPEARDNRLLAGARQQVEAQAPRKAVDAAVTDLIEAIDCIEFPAR